MPEECFVLFFTMSITLLLLESREFSREHSRARNLGVTDQCKEPFETFLCRLLKVILTISSVLISLGYFGFILLNIASLFSCP